MIPTYSTSKMEAAISSETSVNFHPSIRCHIENQRHSE